ncbi:hypothetical protein IO382_001371 [Campylobacter lari]|nr:hypothetical protein [Campylobacter lari]
MYIYILRTNNFYDLKNTFKIFAQNSKIFFLILEIFIEEDENNQKHINQNLLNHIKPYELKTMIEETFKNPSDDQKEIVDFYKDKLSHYKSLIQ